MKERKHEAPPRYDAAFKEGAIRLVAEEGRPMREVAEELGVCTDTIRNWLKASGIQCPLPGKIDTKKHTKVE